MRQEEPLPANVSTPTAGGWVTTFFSMFSLERNERPGQSSKKIKYLSDQGPTPPHHSKQALSKETLFLPSPKAMAT